MRILTRSEGEGEGLVPGVEVEVEVEVRVFLQWGFEMEEWPSLEIGWMGWWYL